MLDFDGVIAAAVTPRRIDSYEANLATFLEVVDFLCKFPLDGMLVLGTTGDMVHFDVPERIKILEFAVKRSQIPVIAGVTHSTLEGTVELAQHAARLGCAGLAVMPPYYFRYRQPEIEAFYREFARRVGVSVPIILYNIPAFTSDVETETIVRLVEEGLVVGVKDSSGDRSRMHQLLELQRRKPFHLMVGDDRLMLEGRQHPGVGTVSGIASAVPELLVGLAKAISTSHDEKARVLDAMLQEICDCFDEFPNSVAVKEALAARLRVPIPPATPLSFERQQKLAEFQKWFEEWLPKVQQACAAD